MRSRNFVVNTLRRFKNRFNQEYGITDLGIFGSTARFENQESSDIDIVVKMIKPDLFYLVHVKEELEEAFKVPVDIVQYRDSMNELLKRRIDAEAIYV